MLVMGQYLLFKFWIIYILLDLWWWWCLRCVWLLGLHGPQCSLPGFSVRGILQARRLEWVAISFSRGSSLSGDQTCVCLLHWQSGSVPLAPPGPHTPTHTHVRACVLSRSVVSNPLQPYGLQPTRFLCPWDFPGKNNAVGCLFLLQGIFLTQGLKIHLPYLLHW